MLKFQRELSYVSKWGVRRDSNPHKDFSSLTHNQGHCLSATNSILLYKLEIRNGFEPSLIALNKLASFVATALPVELPNH